MTINVTIERLVLEGLPVTAHQGRAVGEALEAELARLLGEGELPQHITAPTLLPRLNGGAFAVGPGLRPDVIGEQLARPIAGALRQ